MTVINFHGIFKITSLKNCLRVTEEGALKVGRKVLILLFFFFFFFGREGDIILLHDQDFFKIYINVRDGIATLYLCV